LIYAVMTNRHYSACMAKPISILNHVLGPVMRGPSSSHSAGSLRIGRLCRDLLGGNVTAIDCEYDPNGSLVTTHLSQGSDAGLTGGLLGWETDDERLLDYRKHASDAGLRFDVHAIEYGAVHPNTYRLQVYNGDEHHMVTAVSVGGGMIEVTDIDGMAVSLEGDQHVLIAYAADGTPLGIRSSAKPLQAGAADGLKADTDAAIVRHLQPVVPVCGDRTTQVPFRNAATMLGYDGDRNSSLPQLALEYEAARSGLSQDEVRRQLAHVLAVMQESLRVGRAGTNYADRILPSQVGRYQSAAKEGLLIGGSTFNEVVTFVTSVLEAKSAMQVIVAAPTAGSCGVLPGALLGVGATMNASAELLVDALLTAGLIGMFIADGATFAAEEGGCMAECGSASGMAAAALVVMADGSTQQGLAAASQALQNSFGMTCDTVANRVEAPCLGKNTMAAAYAIAAANMALAGFDHLIPIDEVIIAMAKVGKQMPRELCCTGLGGIAICPSSKALEARLNN
jgi:L-serine dehydratase